MMLIFFSKLFLSPSPKLWRGVWGEGENPDTTAIQPDAHVARNLALPVP